MNLYKQLANVQQELKAPKDQRNNFGNYNYRSCEGILEAVKPLLAKNDLALTLTDEMVEVGGRIYVKATATVFPTNDNGGVSITTDKIEAKQYQCVSVSGFAREEENKKGMDSSQITGAASSYARKYALNGLFCIDDNKDSDATNTHGKDVQTTTKANKDTVLERAGDTEYFMCVDCHKPAYPFQKKDGSVMAAADMLKISMQGFGRPLCKDCYKKALNESKNQ